MVPFAKLPPFTSMAADPDHSMFFLAFADGTVAAYSWDDFSRPVRTFHVGWVLDDMILDAKRSQVVALATPPSAGKPARRSWSEAMPVRDGVIAFAYAP
jgi:hypothetical protein